MSSGKRKPTLDIQNNCETTKYQSTNVRKNTGLRRGQIVLALC